MDGYRGGFIEHYLVEPVHPAGLTTSAQVLLYVVVIAVNLVAYLPVRRQPAASQTP